MCSGGHKRPRPLREVVASSGIRCNLEPHLGFDLLLDLGWNEQCGRDSHGASLNIPTSAFDGHVISCQEPVVQRQGVHDYIYVDAVHQPIVIRVHRFLLLLFVNKSLCYAGLEFHEEAQIIRVEVSVAIDITERCRTCAKLSFPNHRRRRTLALPLVLLARNRPCQILVERYWLQFRKLSAAAARHDLQSASSGHD